MKAVLIKSPAELSIRSASIDAALELLIVGTRVFDGLYRQYPEFTPDIGVAMMVPSNGYSGWLKLAGGGKSPLTLISLSFIK